MKKLILLCSAVLCFSLACNTPSKDSVKCDFDQQAMLTNYADNLIVPRFENLDLGLQFLQSSVDAFVADPTLGLLVEIHVMYRAAYLAYQDCSPFALGPGLINGVPFRERFNTFPTNANLIEQNVQGGIAVSASPRSAVGFPAIDYLIFGAPNITDQQIVDLFTTDVNAANRKAYLQALVSELRSTTAAIVAGWDTYRETFISNTGTAEGTSISLLVNEFTFDFETLKNFKFKIPLGKFNGGVVVPESVEAYYAGGSAELARKQVLGMSELYRGIAANGADNLGLHDLVQCLAPLTEEEQNQGQVSLADEIADQFVNIQNALELVPDPMSETLLTNKPIVDAAHDQMQIMVPLIKHEMTTLLGVQINYQDNDGD